MAKKAVKQKMDLSKLSVLDSVLADITKKFGKEAINYGAKAVERLDAIPTGSLLIDEASGVGGIPRGRIVEIYGPESSGKTTLTLHVIAEAQKMGLICAFVDAEFTFDRELAEAIGVDIDSLLISQPQSGEQALEIVDALSKSGQVGLVVVDSVAALVPQKELDGEMGDSHMGLQARMMSQGLRKLTSGSGTNNCTIIFINQTRDKIGVMFGSPETTTGGNALKFYASLRIRVSKGSEEFFKLTKKTAKGEDVQYGGSMKFEFKKNKVAPPFRKGETANIFGLGISKDLETLKQALDLEIIKKEGRGGHFLDEIRVANSAAEMKEKFIKNDPNYDEELVKKVLKKVKDYVAPVVE